MVRLWGPLEERREHAGLLEAALSSHPVVAYDPQRSAAGRAVDYSVADEIALAAVAALLVIAAVPLLPQLSARLRGHPVKASVFIGWCRLLWVVLIGAGLPLLLYGVYAYATPLSGRSYGLLYTHSRLPVQYFALAAVMGGLLRLTTNRAARQRAAELGIAVPPPDRGWVVVQFIIVAVLAVATIAYLVAWRPADPNVDPDRLSARGLCELVLVFLLGTYALISLLSAGSRPLFERTDQATSFLQKLWARYPGWPLYAGFMAAATASLWLMWVALPAGARGSATLILLSVSLAAAVVLGLGILIRLFEIGGAKEQRSATSSTLDPATAWRAAPLTFAAAALAIVLVGTPILRHVERTSLEDFDQRLRLWDDVQHGPYAQVRDQLSALPG